MKYATCLSPIEIVNPHYKKIAQIDHFAEFGKRIDYKFEVPCGRCYLCRKRYSAQWRFRLRNEFQYGNHDIAKCWFITLTIAPIYYHEALINASKFVRTFLEKYRYLTRKNFGRKNEHSVFHWIVSERGEKKGRLHFHGLLFDCKLSRRDIEKCWPFGFVAFKRMTLRRCCYVTKYITKYNTPSACEASRNHQPRVWCSAGIGKCWITDQRKQWHTQKGLLIPFIVDNGQQYAMPRYYKGKIFNEEQKQILYDQWVSQLQFAPEPPYCIGKLQFFSYWSWYEKLEELVSKYPLFPIDEERRKKRLKRQFDYKYFNYPNLPNNFENGK